ncbi:MAG: Calx-beta domain-containing protein [Bacteroidota bacterium]
MKNYREYTIFLIFIICLLFLISDGLAQTGPGGVGNSTSNRLWLKADGNVFSDAGVTPATNGAKIQQWNDNSGNANHATQTNIPNKPIYKSNIINSKPAIQFTGDTYIDPSSLGIPGTGGFSMITLFETTSYSAGGMSDGSGDYIIDRTTVTNELTSLKIANTNKYAFQKRDNGGGGLGGPVSTSNVSTSSFTLIDYMRERGTAYRLFLNGTQESSIADGDGDLTPPIPRIGRHCNTANGGLKGYIAELMIFNYKINNAQINIINSYLAAKYNLTISNNKYSYGSTHGNDVAGIGREDASNIHADAMSANILEVSTPTSMSNGDYLLFGHDNASVSSWTATEAPNSGTDIKRIACEWRLNETDGGGGDGVGTVKFTVDTTLLPARPSDYSKFVLLTDADGDFSSGASVYELYSTGANQYFEISTLDISNGDYISIGIVRPVVQFSSALSSGFEPVNASITITLNYIPYVSTTVDYYTTDGSAVAPSDYNAVPAATAIIPAGSMTKVITITINNDVLVENDETFSITLTNPGSGINLGTITIHTYTIHDDDNSRKIYFTASSSSGNENVTPVNITISIDASQIDIFNPTTVDYYVSSGTATGGGVDYTLLGTGTATIPPNNQTTTISISVNDDALYESNETVIITLTNPTNGNLSSTNPIIYTYTINDNDSPPTIQFSATGSSGAESLTPVNFQVDLSVISGLNASVNYTVTGTASGGGIDFNLASGTIIITDGNISNNITSDIIDDALVELSETIIITLSSPTNATLGVNTVYTYTILDNDVFGYTGPGGVGDPTKNKLWLKANADVYSDAGLTPVSDGSAVWQWNDQSGNSNHASQATVGNRPVYKENIVNSQPAIRFTGNTFIAPGALGISGTGGFTYFIVFKDTLYSAGAVTNGSGDYIIDRTTGTNELAGLKIVNTNKIGFQKRDNSGGGLGGPVSTSTVSTTSFQIADYMRERGVSYRIYVNSTMENSIADADGDLTPPVIQIGRHATLANQGIKGYIAEVVLYNNDLNTAQRIIIENYLAAKYNIAIAAGSQKYSYAATHGNEVAGIGREDANNFHTDAKGSSIVRMNNASSLDNGDYLLWGHDDASSVLNTTDVPPGINNRMNRVWRLSKTNDPGTVSVSFDLTGYSVNSGDDLVLLIDADGTFTDATQYTTGRTWNPPVVTFTDANFTDGNFFTIASSSSSTPLPVELLSFTGQFVNDKVLLEWATASEKNNDYFTVEKNSGGNEFEQITTVKGAGNSNLILHYDATDYNPLSGISYYRLRQTDYDGKYSFSSIITVQVTTKQDLIQIFPNPVNDVLTIIFSTGLDELTITNIHEKTIKRYSLKGKTNSACFSVKELPAGVYFVTIINNSNEYFRYKLIKNK